jgi:hypothetical protein
LLNESVVLIMRANIESVWNAESDGTPAQLGFAQRNYFSREDHGGSSGVDGARNAALSLAYMQVKHQKHVKGSPDTEIRLGIASWDDGHGEDKSAKWAWKDKNGHVARGGEVPVEALPEMLKYAIQWGYLKREPCKKSR